jgi:hypothetical protein
MASFAQQLPEDPALREQIRKLDIAHAEAIFEGNKAALQERLPADHTVNHPTNRIVEEKTERLKLIDDGVIRYAGFERRPEGFLFYRDLVVVMGDQTVVPAPGAPNEARSFEGASRMPGCSGMESGVWHSGMPTMYARHPEGRRRAAVERCQRPAALRSPAA